MIKYEKLEDALPNENKIYIIDKNVYFNWNNRLNKVLSNDKFFIVISKEDNKTNQTYQKILNFLFENAIDRSYTLVAIGGGIVGDIAGFVASTFMRGLKLVHVPTTVLAMCDSSIGGKNGFNNEYGKNMIGSIYQPKLIIIDISFLETLSEYQKINGMAEVIKIALIKKGELFDLIKDSNFNNCNFSRIIKLSSEYKLCIINDDINDTTGKRELLNFGHTFGHALEFSNNLLHGYAVAYGIIEELKYTQYYYGYPDIEIITSIEKILKNWKLIDDSPLNYNWNLFSFYLNNDKKSNRLITLQDIGKPKIVTFSSHDWFFLKSKYFSIKNNSNYKKNISIKVPSSKSITNRVLLLTSIISQFNDKEIKIKDWLSCQDTHIMIKALRQSNVNLEINKNNINITPSILSPKGAYFLGNSGTTARFILPILALTCTQNITIDGSNEMRKRPIGPLVESLNKLGCNISNNNFFPLVVKPSNLYKNNIEINGELSSQYVSGLMFAYAFLKLKNPNINYKIKIIGEKTSEGFIDLTIKLFTNFGFQIDYTNNEITFLNFNKGISEYTVEGDSTTASYLLAWSYLNKFTLEIKNINKHSTQSDTRILQRMSQCFGNLTINNTLKFTPWDKIKINKATFDLDSSDTFLTWSVLFLIENVSVEIKNIKNQNWKECSRIDNFIKNASSINAYVKKTPTGFRIYKNNLQNDIQVMKTYNDHRMAMAFSLLGGKYDKILIENPHCVNKTFPLYWNYLEDMNINIIPSNKNKIKNIVLIGMPGVGKTTLANAINDNLGITSYDTDRMILESSGENTIKDYIDNNGWNLFREKEESTMLELLQEDKLKIISTGGGIIENSLIRNHLDDAMVITIKRNTTVNDRVLQSDIFFLERKRKPLYESTCDYIYNNNTIPYDFVEWFKIIIGCNPIPNKSTFLCKVNSSIESNISNVIELRGDLMDNYGLDEIQNTIINYKRNIIYTLRTDKEGGKFKYDKNKYIQIINKAIKLGVHLIDIEVHTNIKMFNVKTIGSIHSNDINYIQDNLKKFNYDILKIVTNYDNCKLLNGYNFNDIILIDNSDGFYRCDNNLLTPIASNISQATFHSQLKYSKYLDMCYIYHNKKFLFLFGNTIGSSPSSYLHNSVMKDVNYLNFETNDLQDILNIIKKNYFYGASITMPFKESILTCNQIITTERSINTIVVKENKLFGYNTDKLAIMYFLKNKNTYILGTGGTSIAAIEACKEYNIHNITIIGRNIDSLKSLKNKYQVNILQLNKEFISNDDYQIINCLPPFVEIDKYISDSCYFIDMTYGFHSIVKSKSNYVTGYDILYVQGAYQCSIWKNITFEEVLPIYKSTMNKYLKEKYNNIDLSVTF